MFPILEPQIFLSSLAPVRAELEKLSSEMSADQMRSLLRALQTTHAIQQGMRAVLQDVIRDGISGPKLRQVLDEAVRGITLWESLCSQFSQIVQHSAVPTDRNSVIQDVAELLVQGREARSELTALRRRFEVRPPQVDVAKLPRTGSEDMESIAARLREDDRR